MSEVDHHQDGSNAEVLGPDENVGNPGVPAPRPYIDTPMENLPAGPDGLLQVAVARGASVDELEKLLALKERYDAAEAKKAFTVAMAEFKKNAPVIFKDKHVSFDTDKGTTSYSHATLGNASLVIAESLANYGLSHRWEVNQDDPQRIVCTCIITHELGHSEQTTLIAGADASGGKNPIQAIASAVSYLERYTLFGATGIAAQEDDDAQAAGVEYCTEEQLTELRELAEQIPKFNAGFFFKSMKIGSLEELPQRRFKQAKKVLEAKAKNAQ